MPFLKALMPWATSPINSEILPRPNNSSTTPITTIQCQRLMEPIGLTFRYNGPRGRGHASRFSQNLGLAASKNKDRRLISPYDQWAQLLFTSPRLRGEVAHSRTLPRVRGREGWGRVRGALRAAELGARAPPPPPPGRQGK